MPERRKAPRYSLGVEGTVNPPTGGAGTKVSVSVISTLGCSIECADRAAIGKKCEVYFTWQDLQLGLQAQVVWKSGNGYGLKFYAVDLETQRRLNDLCKALLIQPPAVSKALPTDSPAQAARPATAPVMRQEPSSSRSRAEQNSSQPAIKAHERRRVPRYVSELHAELSNPASSETWALSLVTLSVLGGCLEGHKFPAVGTPCQLSAEWEGKRLAIDGEVVWIRKGQVGVKFKPLSESAEKLLRQVCASLRLQPMAPLPTGPN